VNSSLRKARAEVTPGADQLLGLSLLQRRGRLVGGRLCRPEELTELVIAEIFEDPNVERIHTRNVVFVCYMLRPPSSGAPSCRGYEKTRDSTRLKQKRRCRV
jgi:hypothetical protein